LPSSSSSFSSSPSSSVELQDDPSCSALLRHVLSHPGSLLSRLLGSLMMAAAGRMRKGARGRNSVGRRTRSGHNVARKPRYPHSHRGAARQIPLTTPPGREGAGGTLSRFCSRGGIEPLRHEHQGRANWRRRQQGQPGLALPSEAKLYAAASLQRRLPTSPSHPRAERRSRLPPPSLCTSGWPSSAGPAETGPHGRCPGVR
jgi:hypothetical protein